MNRASNLSTLIDSVLLKEQATGVKYWAQRGKNKVGPHPTREAAVAAFKTEHPHKGPDYMRGAKKNQITSGHGEHGPNFNIQWHDA